MVEIMKSDDDRWYDSIQNRPDSQIKFILMAQYWKVRQNRMAVGMGRWTKSQKDNERLVKYCNFCGSMVNFYRDLGINYKNSNR